MGWYGCSAMSGRCRASSGGGAGGWSACASHPFTRSQSRFRRAFPCSSTGVYGWGICAKNWQRRQEGQIEVAESLTFDVPRVTLDTLKLALYDDLATDKDGDLPSTTEKSERA